MSFEVCGVADVAERDFADGLTIVVVLWSSDEGVVYFIEDPVDPERGVANVLIEVSVPVPT